MAQDTKRKIRLGAFVHETGQHVAAWRHPGAHRHTGAPFAEMDFAMLYDRARQLFAIGYHTADRRLDTSYYDLLASEARLTCFVAIAQGQVSQESWFALGRQLTTAGDKPVLLS